MACANNSFPVPLSPRISTGSLLRANRFPIALSACITLVSPTRSSNVRRPPPSFPVREVPDLAFELLEVVQQLLNALIVVCGNDHFRKAADQISFVVQNGATAA